MIRQARDQIEISGWVIAFWTSNGRSVTPHAQRRVCMYWLTIDRQ